MGDTLVATGTSAGTAVAVPGLRDKAIVLTVLSGIDLQVLKGTTFVDIALTVTGKTTDEMLSAAKQFATEIRAKI